MEDGQRKDGYFRVPLDTAHAIVRVDPDPELLVAWLVLRCYAFGNARELTAAGAKKIATALGISRPRAGKLLQRLLALRYGKRGAQAVIMTAADWNDTTGPSVPLRRGPGPVYVMPDPGGEQAYLPMLLIPGGDARSPLADLCDLDNPILGLDSLNALLLAYHATSLQDFCGADPELFASYDDWKLAGDVVAGDGDFELGYMGLHRGRHYWLASRQGENESETSNVSWPVVEAVTGGRTAEHGQRFWRAIEILEGQGLLHSVAVVLDARGRLLYPLWFYGEPTRDRMKNLGIVPDLARKFQRQAEAAGMCQVNGLAAQGMNCSKDHGFGTGLFVCATPTMAQPTIRTIYSPMFAAATPDNMKGFEHVANLIRRWL